MNMKAVAFLTTEESFSEVITVTGASASLRPLGITKNEVATNLNIYPNPAISSASIDFILRESGTVNLKLYDVSGKLAFSIPGREYQSGNHLIKLDASDLRSGIYQLRLITESEVISKSLIIH